MPALVAHASSTSASTTIKGTVTDFVGDPISDIDVSAIPVSDDGDDESDAYTSASGAYTLPGLTAGSSYKLEYYNEQTGTVFYYTGVAGGTTDYDSAVPVAAGNSTAKFVYADSPTETVHITSRTGATLSRLSVELVPLVNGVPDFQSPDFAWGLPVAGQSGTYHITGLNEGESYTLQISGSTIYSQYMGGSPSYLYAEAPITADSDPQSFELNADRGTLNVTALSAPALSGTVTSTSGTKLSGVDVQLYRFDGLNYNLIDDTQSSSKGAYSFPSEPAGSYKVQFTTYSGGTGAKYISAWYGGASLSTATAIYLTPTTAKTASVKLGTGGSITGTLLNSDNSHGAYISVTAYPLLGSAGNYTAGDPIYTSAGTTSKGTFTVPGLAAGTYALSFYGYDDNQSPIADTYNPNDLGGANSYVVKAGKATAAGTIQLQDVSDAATADVSGQIDGGPDDLADYSAVNFNRVGNINDYASASINPGGSFEADLIPGTYTYNTFVTDDENDVYSTSTGTVTVTAGDNSLHITVEATVPLSFVDPQPSITASGDSDNPLEVGSTFTLANVTPTHQGTDTIAFQWLRDGHPIYGATSQSYTATGSDAGSVLSGRVTVQDGSGDSGPDIIVASVDAGIITPGTLSQGTASIAPIAPVTYGATLTASTGTWTATDASGTSTKGVAFSYQWYRDADTTTKITGATARTYKTTAADAGHNVHVVVTGTKAGYDDGNGDNPVDAIAAPSNSVSVLEAAAAKATTAPKVTSKVVKGVTTYTVSAGKWSVKGTKYSYQWLSDGQPFETAETSSTLVNPDVPNAAITVVVTAKATGHQDGTATALARKGVNGEDNTAPVISVGKTPIDDPTTAVHVGEILRDTPVSVWNAPQSQKPTYTYKWERFKSQNSTTNVITWSAISGATKATYVPTSSDVGKALQVITTVSSPYYAPITFTQTAGVGTAGAASSFDGVVTVTHSGTSIVAGTKLTAKDSGYPSTTTFTYQWSIAGGIGAGPVTGATKSTFTVPAAAAGEPVYVSVIATYKTTVDEDSSDQIYVSLPTQLDTISSPTITGKTVTNSATNSTGATSPVGATLTAYAGIWNVTGAKYTYQWTRNGINIPGATATTYVPTGDNLGDNVTVKVSAAKTGLTSGSDESDAVKITAGVIGAPTTLPKISGTAKDGSTLTATAGIWAVSGLMLTYQWLNNGEAIPKATGNTYVVDAVQLGAITNQPTPPVQKISVRVTANRPGYAGTSADSAATKAVPLVPNPLD